MAETYTTATPGVAGHETLPAQKKARLNSSVVTINGTSTKPQRSRLFAPFRSLGHVTTSVPFAILQHTSTFQITTSTGFSACTYDIRRLNLLFVTSPETPSEITSLLARGKELYVGFKDGVWIFQRGKKVGELEFGKDESLGFTGFKQLVAFGEWVVGIGGRKKIYVWNAKSRELYTVIELFGKSEIVGVFHPATYLNKICVGTSDGSMEIWNLRTGKLVYTVLPPVVQNGSKSLGALTAIAPTPHHSIVALGFSSGIVHLHNFETDTPLFQLSSKGAVTYISVRTDMTPPPPNGTSQSPKPSDMIAVGSSEGDVTIFSLSRRRVLGIMRGAHSGGAVRSDFLQGQSVLLTTGGDNSMKLWVFDTPTTVIPRILRHRAGHSKAPGRIVFHPSTHYILSAGLDRSLWGFSLRSDAQNRELSQGSAERTANKLRKTGNHDSILDASAVKGGVITCIAVEGNRDGAGAEWGSNELGWEGVLTGGRGESSARAWSWSRRKVGRWTLPTGDGSEVKSVAITPCGSFGLVGSLGGTVDAYNLQSGQHRRRFPERATKAQIAARKPGEGSRVGWKHSRSVEGIAVDSVNRLLITCGLDGFVKFWEFNTGLLTSQLSFGGTACTALKLHRPSNLFAVSCDDLGIRVVDLETRKVVRELWGCGGRISDFCFSNDARWLIASSTDSVIRIWDLPTGHLIDGFKTHSIVTSVAFAPDGAFLATASVDSVGVGLWTNRTLFSHVPTRRMLESEIVSMSMPSASGEGGTGLADAALDNGDDEDGEIGGVYTSVEQLSEDMLTMSLLPKARWRTLINLEYIKERNKPKEPLKAPAKAPFFLPSLEKTNPIAGEPMSTDATAVIASTEDIERRRAKEAAELSRVKKFSLADGANAYERPFTVLLLAAAEDGEYSKFISHLKTLPPSATDLEIRSLDMSPPFAEPITFVQALTAQLRTKRDYELVLAWMRVFLKIHADIIFGLSSTGDEEEEEEEDGDEDMQEGDDDDEEGEVKKSDTGKQLVEALGDWKAELKKEKERISELVNFCGGVASFLRSSR